MHLTAFYCARKSQPYHLRIETENPQWEHQAPSPGPGSMLSCVAVCDSFVTAQRVIQRVSVATAILVSNSPDHNPDHCCCHAC